MANGSKQVFLLIYLSGIGMEQGTAGQEQRGKVRPQGLECELPLSFMELCAGLSHFRPKIHSSMVTLSSGVATLGGFGPEFAGDGIAQGQNTLAQLLVMHHICGTAHHLPVSHPALSKAVPNILLCFLHRVFKKTSPNSKVSVCAPSPRVASTRFGQCWDPSRLGLPSL